MTDIVNPKVLTSFLNVYLEVRTFKWNSLTGWLLSFYRDDASIKSSDCISLNKRFYVKNTLQTFDGLVELLNDLGTNGQEQSFLCATQHAIRTYIISRMLTSTFGAQLELLRRSLQADVVVHETHYLEAMKNQPKREVEKLKAIFHMHLLKLANLGDDWGIWKAMQENLFHNLFCPVLTDRTLPFINKLNENFPYFYHDFYHLFHYERNCRAIKQSTFEDFEINASKAEIEVPPPTDSTVAAAVNGVVNGVFSLFYAAKVKIENFSQSGPKP